MTELNINISSEEVKEIFSDAIRSEAVAALKRAIYEDDIRKSIRDIFASRFAEKSPLEKAIISNLDSTISSAIWNLFDEPEIKGYLLSLIRVEIESEDFKKMIKEAVYQSAWTSSVKINPDGIAQG